MAHRPTRGTRGPWKWTTTNPSKDHNFDATRSVHSIDEFYHRKYEEDLKSLTTSPRSPGAEEIMADQEAHREAHMHMPSPSYWPMVIVVRSRRWWPSASSSATSSRWSACSSILVGAPTAGCRSRRWRRSTTTTRRPTYRARRSWRPLTDITLADAAKSLWAPHMADYGRWGARRRRPRHQHRPVQQQAGMWLFLGVGVPAVRRPHLDVHPLQGPHREGPKPDQV